MPRLLNIQIPDDKRVLIGLTYIKGIGRSRSRSICRELGIEETTYMYSLTKNQLSSITVHVRNNYIIGQKVLTDVLTNIKLAIKISSYKGLRHFKGLPVRGQRTKTNARTSKRLQRKVR